MQLDYMEAPEEFDIYHESIWVGSVAKLKRIESKYHMKCECSCELSFTDNNYDVAIVMSERDENATLRAAGNPERLYDINKKASDYWRGRLMREQGISV
jgi:hypothetical protein